MVANTKQNSILLIGNNGSVPEEFSKSFKLFILDNGITHFEHLENGTSLKESGSISISEINTLFSKAKRLKLKRISQINIGGPQKEIILNTVGTVNTIKITESDPEALDFYKQCLFFFDASLPQKLAGIL